MKSIVELDIVAPQERVAELFSDPRNLERWMDDAAYEPMSGVPGEVGSTYRLGQTFRSSRSRSRTNFLPCPRGTPS